MTTYSSPNLIADLQAQIDLLEERICVLEAGRPKGTRAIENEALDKRIMVVFEDAPASRFDRKAVAINLGEEETSSALYQKIARRLTVLDQMGKIKRTNDNPSRPVYTLS